MSVLDVLDATRLCQPALDSSAWVSRPSAPVRREPPPLPPVEFSWFSLARNPQALLLTGVIAAGWVRDALARAATP